MRRRFPVRHGAGVIQLNRKLLAKGFLSGMGTLCFNSIGNYLRMVSYRHGDIVFQFNRKLFANGFLFGMGALCFSSIGNYLRMVSCPAWYHCVSYRPEISRLRFAALEMTVGRGGDVNHTDGKLLANSFLSDVGTLCFSSIGNYLRMVSCPAWGHCVSTQ